jgi:hypothetical protein
VRRVVEYVDLGNADDTHGGDKDVERVVPRAYSIKWQKWWR